MTQAQIKFMSHTILSSEVFPPFPLALLTETKATGLNLSICYMGEESFPLSKIPRIKSPQQCPDYSNVFTTRFDFKDTQNFMRARIVKTLLNHKYIASR